MPVERMLGVTREFLARSPAPEGIVFYGGEPLLNWPALRSTIQLARRESLPTEITVFTNGTLITPEIAQFIADLQVGVILSLDGDAFSHNQCRLKRQGGGSYSASLRGLRRLQAAGCMTGISCVVGPHNAERIELVTEHLCGLGPVNIGMNVLHEEARSGYAFSPQFGANAVLRAAKVAARYGIEIEQAVRRLRSFVTETSRRGDCPACGTRLVVTPEGGYGPCEGAYPFLPAWFFPDQAEVQGLSSRLAAWPHSNTECATCEAVGLCGSG